MAYNQAWDENAPDGATTKANTIDTVIQDLKKSIRERMADLLHDDTSWETDADEPKKIKYSAIKDPPVIAAAGYSQAEVNAAITAALGNRLPVAWMRTTSGSTFVGEGIASVTSSAYSASGFDDNIQYAVVFNAGVVPDNGYGIIVDALSSLSTSITNKTATGFRVRAFSSSGSAARGYTYTLAIFDI